MLRIPPRFGRTTEPDGISEITMSYEIQCRKCAQKTSAWNIVDLVDAHVEDVTGRFVCEHCGGTDTFIYRESKLQEEGEMWKRWIKGIIQIDSGVETYSPYIFLTADSEDSLPTGLHFNYYKNTRSYPNGRLKHGHGPGGAPVLHNDDLFVIIKHLVALGTLSKEELLSFAARLGSAEP